MDKFFSKLNPKDFEGVVDSKKVSLFILKNANGLEISVSNFGGRVVEIFTPDRNGVFEDIALGHDTLDEYVHYKAERFLGATIGRFGNRIAGGRFSLGGKEYVLALNNGKNSLHGGLKGFDMKVWDVLSANSSEIVFALESPDGDEGFPAKLNVKMTYRLTADNAFEITHEARSDADTIVNLTHHSFFNLHGAGVGDINDHIMTIDADHYLPVDANLIPTGEIASVRGTPFDFLKPTQIGSRLGEKNEQFERARGYDHNWVLNKSAPGALDFAAEVYEPKSGRALSVFTTEPGMQFYGGNFFSGNPGKGGKPYVYRGALALETQHFPDSPNQPNFPTTVLKAGGEYRHVCKYVFSAR
ncbi:MAG: galactose mutarotase [Opitutales bacterium]|nr:galactose mutarotase [Opitutales bacterium]